MLDEKAIEALRNLLSAVDDMMMSEDDTGCDGGLTVADKASMEQVEQWAERIKRAIALQDYVDRGGVNCPACNDHNIEMVGTMDENSDGKWQSCVCHNCEARWTDYYKLVAATFDEDPK